MCKKIILPGLLAGLAMLVVSMLVSWIFGLIVPSLAKVYVNSGIFRPWTDPLMMLYFVYPFLLGLLLSWFWNKTKSSFDGKSVWCKGAKFGFAIFLIATIPGMFMTYSSFVLPFTMILSWTVSGLLELVVAGFILANLNK